MYKQGEKMKYYTATLPDGELAYSYSAIHLQAELNKLFAGKKLRAIYVPLDDYLEADQNRVNIIDLSCIGGLSLIVFDTAVLELVIRVEGMLEYRWFPIQEIELQEKYDYPPEDVASSDRYYFDLSGHELAYDYKGKTVQSITVGGTDTWGFSQPAFHEEVAEVAAENRDLPTEVILHTNEFDICFVGDSIEYYVIAFERAKST